MKIEDLLKMDMGEAIEWLTENAENYELVPVQDDDSECEMCNECYPNCPVHGEG